MGNFVLWLVSIIIGALLGDILVPGKVYLDTGVRNYRGIHLCVSLRAYKIIHTQCPETSCLGQVFLPGAF